MYNCKLLLPKEVNRAEARSKTGIWCWHSYDFGELKKKTVQSLKHIETLVTCNQWYLCFLMLVINGIVKIPKLNLPSLGGNILLG